MQRFKRIRVVGCKPVKLALSETAFELFGGKNPNRLACVKGIRVPIFVGIWVEPRRNYTSSLLGRSFLFFKEEGK
jgi:hypothetical protein